MKKLIISASMLSFILIGCNNSKTGDKAVSFVDSSHASIADSAKSPTTATVACKPKDMKKFKVFKQDEVGVMADHYRDLVFENYQNATQQVTLDPVTLREMACHAKTFKLISAAEDKDITMIIEYAKDEDAQVDYYDLLEIFGKGSLCPPPNNCGITDTIRNPTGKLTKEQIDSFCTEYDMNKYPSISAEEAAKMAAEYKEVLKDDYRKVIQQITMDPDLLYAILCSVDGFKLVAAANDKGEVTMVISYTRNGTTSYYDIKGIFGANVLCPPPDNCGIPYQGLIKKNTKRPAQK